MEGSVSRWGVNADKVMFDDVRPCHCDVVYIRGRGNVRVLCPVKHDCGCGFKKVLCILRVVLSLADKKSRRLQHRLPFLEGMIGDAQPPAAANLKL